MNIVRDIVYFRQVNIHISPISNIKLVSKQAIVANSISRANAKILTPVLGYPCIETHIYE